MLGSSFRLVDGGWEHELSRPLTAGCPRLRIICPFIKAGPLQRLLERHSPASIEVVTRFNLGDFAQGVSDISALRHLLKHGARVRGVRNLHAKVFLFGAGRAIATSANLTESAWSRNHEFGFVSEDPAVIASCDAYFEHLWVRSNPNLRPDQVDTWDEIVTPYLAGGARPGPIFGFGDFGADLGLSEQVNNTPIAAADAPQAFVKFLGEAHGRIPLTTSVFKEVQESGCHWALGYPASKRPRSVRDGALMFIGRLTADPNDIRIFGRAIGMRHVEGRDEATAEDIQKRGWKATWPQYIRVHHAEFVAGTLANGVSLNVMMSALGAASFTSTAENARKGMGNTNPRNAYRQLPAVQLTLEGRDWVNARLEAAFTHHGKIPVEELNKLDWPAMDLTRL